MASIAEWIQKIKTAIYGEEVRGAIWQSLEAMNTEVEAINVDEDQIEQNKQDIATNTAAITALNSSMVAIPSTRAEVDALNSKWKRVASIESVDSLVQTLVPAGTPSNMLAGFVWLQDIDKTILPTLGWFKGYYTFQNAYGSPYDAGGYIYLTDGNGKPYGEIYITGTLSAGFTAVLNNKLITRAEVDALNSRTFWRNQIADVTIRANSDTVLTLSKSTKAFIFIASENPDTCGVFMCSATSTSSKVVFFPVLLGSSLSLSADGDKLTITNSSPSVAYAYGFIVDGSGITA